MRIQHQVPVAALLATTPLLAHAQAGGPHILAFVGGAVGGFVGAGLACWMCNRRRPKNDDRDPPKY